MVGAKLALPSSSQLPQPANQFSSGQISILQYKEALQGRLKQNIFNKLEKGAISAAPMLEH